MLLYSEHASPRLRYVASFLSAQTTGMDWIISSDKQAYLSYEGPCLNYSSEAIRKNEIWIRPHGLLSETDIGQQKTDCFSWRGHKAFFAGEGDLPFDLLAASFYLLSRYEEYLPHEKDGYGRYDHRQSLAFREGFLSLPLVDIWVMEFRKLLADKFPFIKLVRKEFSFLPTYDIDEAFSFRHKGWARSFGGTVKTFFQQGWSAAARRQSVRNGLQADPFDAYDRMDAWHESYGLSPRYFFLVPQRLSRYDRNILPSHPAMRQLIARHAQHYTIGLHPSWQSGDDPRKIEQEIKTLQELAGRAIDSSRQHFIRFTLPDTFRQLLAAGIKKDFSMGYGSINGFRASTSNPFHWFDLEKSEATQLLLYPFCYMEANSFFEQGMSPAQAFDEMISYYRTVHSVNGTFITIWHNTFLGNEGIFKGWGECYGKFLEELCSR